MVQTLTRIPVCSSATRTKSSRVQQSFSAAVGEARARAIDVHSLGSSSSVGGFVAPRRARPETTCFRKGPWCSHPHWPPQACEADRGGAAPPPTMSAKPSSSVPSRKPRGPAPGAPVDLAPHRLR
jgi:hypothetical protein